jgi:tetratricopeptide (TPR) repeat protein
MTKPYRRLCLSALALLAALALPLSATAQNSKPSEPRGKAAEPRGKPAARPNSPDRSKNLEFLFGALKAAPDEESARLVQARIEALWMVSGSDTADLLMARAKQALDGKNAELSIELLDAVVEIRPEYAEGWNRRATLHFMNKDYMAAMADLRQVLAREPRHFSAMVGMGMILHELDEDVLALKVLRRAMEIHPHLPRIDDLVKSLAEKVDGRDI